MEGRTVDDLVEERVAQLDEITRRRNELLVEMYHLLHKREDVGSVVRPDEVTKQEIDAFLDRFDLLKYPETGRIVNLPEAEFEFYAPPSSTPALTASGISSTAPDDSEEVDGVSERGSSHDELDLVGAYSSADDMDIEDGLVDEQPPRKRARHTTSSSPSRNDVKAEEDEEPDELDLLGTHRPSPDPSHSREGQVPPVSPQQLPAQVQRPLTSLPRSAEVQDSLTSSHVGRASQWRRPSTSSDALQSTAFIPNVLPVVSGSSAIPLPMPWTDEAPHFVFPMEATKGEDITASPRRLLQSQQSPALPYSLPPLKLLPAEYSKKAKSSKARKRDKEREKAPEKGDGRRDEYTPLGANRWGATIRANPVWKKVSRASKCVSSREWSVAMNELKIVRALERIEVLKDQGRWSFRQVRRQRGVGGLTKTHWDHLMDEMRWMRTDFREERKWKTAVAHGLAQAIMEWHEAGTQTERECLGICVRWIPPPDEPASQWLPGPELDMPLGVPGNAEEQEHVENTLTCASDHSEAGEPQDVQDPLEPSAAIREALDAAEQPAINSDCFSAADDVEPKTEDVDDISALRNAGDADAMPVDKAGDDRAEPHGDTMQPKEEEAPLPETAGLRPESTNPMLGDVPAEQKAQVKSALYDPLRERIAYSSDDLLFLDNDLMKLVITAPADEEKRQKEVESTTPSLLTVFSDFQPLDLLDVAPPLPPAQSDGKKKSERKSDKDDPHKRAEDTTYMRLTPMSQFMSMKPTLLGPLKPAEHWKNGHWSNIEDIPVTVESDISSFKPIDESPCGLFQGPSPGRSPLGLNTSLPGSAAEARKRAADYLWSSSEDLLLKSLTDRYPGNWQLICDSFNSSRVAMSADKRSPWDCLERWRLKWGTSSHQAQSTPSDLTPPAQSPETPSMTTRNVRRLASAHAANRAVSTTPANISNSETKKRRRHNLMYDTIRKAAKKRDATQKANANQRKAAAVHDTHGQVNNLPKRSPIELSRVKAEKDAREATENAMRQQQFRTDQLRQHALREQLRLQGGMPMQAQLLQQQQQQLQQQNAAARQNAGVVAAVSNAPQIRAQVGISQQQRTGTPLSAATATRMSPQQLYQVQAQAAQARALATAQMAHTMAGAPVNGAANGGSHLSPPYVARTASGSPAMPQAVPVQAASSSSPRPPSAQAATPAVPGTTGQRPAANIAHYFPTVPSGQLTQDHLLSLQALFHAQQRQAGLQQGAAGSSGQS